MSDTVNEQEFDADVFDAMVTGTFEEPSDEEEVEDGVEDDVEDTEDFDDDSEYQEDTDQEDELEDEEGLDEDDDGDLDEDLEDDDEDEEEDSLVDDNNLDDEDGDTEGEEEDSDDEDESDTDEGTDEVSEDDAETEETNDGESQDTDEIDYKAFYDSVVNAEFTVNGKKVKGFADPKKIIQAQQMAGGFSEKMAGFKQYRPYMAPLKDRGMLDDPAKFDLAMNLIDGDKEAIKKHLQSLDIDPMDLDMDEIAYQPTPATSSKDTLIIEDVLERARNSGIEDRVRTVIGNEWDTESFQEFVNNDAVRNDLLMHIETGVYDNVQDKIAEMKRLDYNGTFGSMNTITQYRTAVREMQNDTNVTNPPKPAAKAPTKPAAKSVTSEKAKIKAKRDEEIYKQEAAKQEAKRIQRRKKAASMSRKKAKAAPKPKFDPMELEGEELEAHMEFLMSGGMS